MTITKNIENGKATFAITGRLESNTSKQLSDELTPYLDEGKTDITLDFAELQFISSAGLRVVFTSHKKCKANNRFFYIVNANEAVQEIFAITGYSGI